MLAGIKHLMKENERFMRFVASVYNLVHYNNAWRYRFNNKIKIDSAFLRKTKFEIHGQNNVIQIGPKARLNNCKIVIIGNGCKFLLGG